MLLALLSLLALFAVMVWESWRASERALASAVDTDIAGLVDIYASGGEAELLRRLEDRTALLGMDGYQARYMLARPGGQAIGGNVAAWPQLSSTISQAGFVELEGGEQVYGRATRLAPDLDLLVARTYQRDIDAIRRLAALFAATATLIVLAVWFFGRKAAGQLRRRVSGISRAFLAAEEGQDPALLEPQRADEIGQLAALSSRAIARMANLARTHRHMSDHIAHEIRTPLTHLDNRIAATMRALPDGCDPQLLEQCRRDIKGVVSMLDSLLDIAASEGRVGDRTGLEQVNLSDLAADLVDLYSGSAEDGGITLRAWIKPDIQLMGERMQLVRLISNLLDNALKYVPRGGTITVKVEPGPVIEIFDDGPGIEPALRPLVFERFRAGTQVQGKSSHGLGLALARAIALRHEMAISLVDSPRGAHFVVKPHELWASGGEQS